jgi:tetratricopeptide (TPR) repeat protein
MSGKPNLEPFKAFVKKYPQGGLAKRAWGMMGSYYGGSAPKAEAEAFYADYTSKYPHDVDAWSGWLARIVRDKEPLDKGVEIAAKIRELTDGDPLPQYSRTIAELYIAKGDKAKAQDIYGQTYMENQASSLAYSLVGYANFWFQQGENKDSALEMADLAFKIYPENWYIRQQAALANVRMDKVDKAIGIFGPAFRQDNNDNVNILRNYARFWANQGKNVDDAQAAIQRAIEIAPTGMWNWDAAGAVYLKLKKYDEALKAAEKALELADADNKEYLKKKLDTLKASIEKEKAAEKK